MPKIDIHQPLFLKLHEVLNTCGTKGYLIGGYVRDRILGIESQDIDIVVEKDAEKIAKTFSQTPNKKPLKISVFKNFGTVHLKYKSLELEFVNARKESYRKHSRNPNIASGTFDDDRKRRDFTINAIAISLNEDFGAVMDPLGGIDDIKKKCLKTPLEPEKTFYDDPLRMIRAIRFSCRLGFTIEAQTSEAIKENKERINIVSTERITEELNKILMTKKPSVGFKLLSETGLLGEFFPELEALKVVEKREGFAHKNNFLHSLQVLDTVCKRSDNLWLRWAALLHDIGKPATKKFDSQKGWTFYGHDKTGADMAKDIFKRLKISNGKTIRYVQKLIFLHLRPISLCNNPVSDASIRRFLIHAGEDIQDLMVLCESDMTTNNKFKIEQFQKQFLELKTRMDEVEKSDSLARFSSPISGKEIMEMLKLPPSRKIGTLKEMIKEAIISGEIKNDREAAKQFLKQKIAPATCSDNSFA